MHLFETHNIACDYIRTYLSSICPTYNIKFTTRHDFRDNIDVFLTTQFDIGRKQENIAIACIFLYKKHFLIGIYNNLNKYCIDIAILSKCRYDFKEESKLLEKMIISDEEKYYEILLHTMKQPLSSQKNIHIQQGSNTKVTALATENTILDASLTRKHGNKFSFGIGHRKIPPIAINSVSMRGGGYKFKPDFSNMPGIHKLPLISSSSRNVEDEMSSWEISGGNAGIVDKVTLLTDNTSIEELALSALEQEHDRHSFFPENDKHPKFQFLTPTTQKLLNMKHNRKIQLLKDAKEKQITY